MNERILIVEDERIVALEISARLKELGYSIIGIVSSGEKAIEKIHNEKPDLVLLDIMLEGEMDGIDTGKIIRDTFGIPFIFITAYSDDATLTRAMGAGPYSYLRKPFEEFELATAIQISFSKNRLEKKLSERENLLATTLGSISDTVISCDSEGQILFMNSKGFELTGVEPQNAIGKNIAELLGVGILFSKSFENAQSSNLLIINEDKSISGECRNARSASDRNHGPMPGSR